MFNLILIFSLFFLSTLEGRSHLKGKRTSNERVFSRIYETAEWGEAHAGEIKGSSGSGSDPKNASPYLEYLQTFLEQHPITTVVDLGCGDWQLGKMINWDNINYLGIDVVESLINQNRERYSKNNIEFVKADGADYELPSADLLICKDVLQHLPFRDILKIKMQFCKFKYCLIVNDVDPCSYTAENHDIQRGGYRKLDMTGSPFFISGDKVLNYVSDIEMKQVLLITN